MSTCTTGPMATGKSSCAEVRSSQARAKAPRTTPISTSASATSKPRDVHDALVERVAEEREAEQRQRGEDGDHHDRQPHGRPDQRGERAREARLAEQLARPRAVREAVEARAHERTPREPAEHDRRQQPDDEQKQGARDTREGVAELIPGALDDGGDHGRPCPRPLRTAPASAEAIAATRPPIARSGTATARCRRARSTSSVVKRELTAGVWLPTSRNSSTARDSAGSRRRFGRIAHLGSSQS